MRTQYFLTFAILGCVLPYLPVYLRERGLPQTEVGFVFAAASVAALLAPVVVTLLADTRFDARSLMALALLLGGAALIGLSLAHAFAVILLWYCLHSLTLRSLGPLQDGLLFAIQERDRRQSGRTPLAYHRVRVWGTIGFIVPSLGLFWLLRTGVRIEVLMIAGAVCSVAAALNAALLLPGAGRRDVPAAAAERSALPTLAALRALTEPHVMVFCGATFLLALSTAPYYAFYPIYLTETVGIDTQWIGLIANIGVVIEIFFVLGFGLLRRRMGLKWLVVAGFACTSARFALLAAAPSVAIAIATQIFHGMMVLMIAVVPPVFLNEYAQPRFRHSMQGLYAMLVMGVAPILGNLLAGTIAQRSLTTLFWLSAATSIAAAALVAVAFHQPAAPPAAAEPPQPGSLPLAEP